MNILCSNKKATFRYAIIKKIEAGLILEGWEVKSLRAGHGQISESYVSIKNNHAFLINSNLKVLPNFSDGDNLDPTRLRQLLLNKNELNQIKNEIKLNNYTIIPLKRYVKKSYLKIEIAIAKGKNIRDKRLDIKTREWERNKKRILKKQGLLRKIVLM